MKKNACILMMLLLVGTLVLVKVSHSLETKYSLTPERVEVVLGQTFTIDVRISNVSNLYTWQLAAKYNSTIINCTAAWVPEDNVFAGQTCASVQPVLNDPTIDGYNYTLFGNSLIAGSVTIAEGILCRLNFTGQATGQTNITLGTKTDPILLPKLRPYDPMPPIQMYSFLENPNLEEMPFGRENSQVINVAQTILSIISNTGGKTDPPSGNYTYTYGTNMSVTAIQNNNCIFDHWLLNNSIEFSNPISLLMKSNYTLQPFFARMNCTLRVFESFNGTLTISPGDHPYPAGETIQAIATANAGFRLDHWLLDDSNAGLDNPLSIVMDRNHTLSAVFSAVSYVGTIYLRADGSIDPSDAPVSTFDNLTYTLNQDTDSMFVVQRNNAILDGRGHVIQGSGSGEGISLFGVNNVTVRNMNVRGFDVGVYLFWAFQNTVSGNNVTGNNWLGVRLYYSSNNSLCSNNIVANKDDGVRLDYSSNDNSMVKNNIVSNNWFGIHIDSSQDNAVYHNNFINNPNQVHVDAHGYFPGNFWDNGLEGNYWSDNIGTDSNLDGICDTPYVIDANNTDHYPTIGKSSSIELLIDCYVDVFSNSTVGNFNYSGSDRRMTFEVEGQSGTFGFCRMVIPHVLIEPAYLQVKIDRDEMPTLHPNYGLHDNMTHRWIYFAYEHSAHEVVVQEDRTPPALTILSPQNKIYSTRDIVLTLTASESICWIGYSLDGLTNVTATGNITLTEVPDGSHSLILYANDSVGNMGRSDAILFSVDATPPYIVGVVQEPSGVNLLPIESMLVNVTVVDNASGVKIVTLFYACVNDTGIWNCTVAMMNIYGDCWSVTIPPLPYWTNVTYTIMAEDNAGNTITTRELGQDYQYRVMPEYPSFLVLLPFLFLLSLAVQGLRRKRRFL